MVHKVRESTMIATGHRLTKLRPHQGILIPLLTTFLSSESSRRPWFKIYVVCVNILTAGQTVVHLIQVFGLLDSVPASAPVTLLLFSVVYT